MQSKNTSYIERLDHVRFLAAATVLMFHSYMAVRGSARISDILPIPLIDQGHTGVPLFMVISGMILAHIAGERELITPKFYLNRVLRIYPLFVFIITLGYFATPDPRPVSVGIDYLMSLLPISNLYRLNYGAYGGHLWSVAVELQFYLLFPLILRFQRQYGLYYIAGLVGLLLCLRLGLYFHHKTIHHLAFFSIFGNIESFLAGMLIGQAFARMDDTRVWWHRPWVLPGAFIAINLVIYGVFLNRNFFHVDYAGVSANGISRSIFWVFWPTAQAVLWGAFLLVYLKTEIRIPFSAALATLGKYSYSIYVWHIAVLYALQKHFPWLPPYAFGALIVLPATVAVAAVSYHLIERPFLEMRVKYLRATPGAERAPAVAAS